MREKDLRMSLEKQGSALNQLSVRGAVSYEDFATTFNVICAGHLPLLLV